MPHTVEGNLAREGACSAECLLQPSESQRPVPAQWADHILNPWPLPSILVCLCHLGVRSRLPVRIWQGSGMSMGSSRNPPTATTDQRQARVQSWAPEAHPAPRGSGSLLVHASARYPGPEPSRGGCLRASPGSRRIPCRWIPLKRVLYIFPVLGAHNQLGSGYPPRVAGVQLRGDAGSHRRGGVAPVHPLPGGRTAARHVSIGRPPQRSRGTRRPTSPFSRRTSGCWGPCGGSPPTPSPTGWGTKAPCTRGSMTGMSASSSPSTPSPPGVPMLTRPRTVVRHRIEVCKSVFVRGGGGGADCNSPS